LITPTTTTILSEIEARMGNIHISNGYSVDVKKVKLGQLEPFKGYDLPAINVWPSTLNVEMTTYEDSKKTLPIFIEIHDSTRDEPFSTVAERLALNVLYAINRSTTAPAVDDDESNCLGGIVDDVVFNGFDYEIGNGQKPFCAALVRFDIVYFSDKNII